MNLWTVNAIASQLNTPWASSYQPESEAIFAEMVPAPDPTRKGLIDDLVIIIKGAGAWGDLDCLEIFLAHSQQAGGVNWIDPGGPIVAGLAGTASWNVDESYAGSGVGSSAILTGFIPSAGVKYQANNSELGYYVHKKATVPTGSTARRPYLGATDVGYLGGLTLADHEAFPGPWCLSYRKSLGKLQVNVNTDDGAQTMASVDALGMFAISQYKASGNNHVTLYKQGDTVDLLDSVVSDVTAVRPGVQVALAGINFDDGIGGTPFFASDAEFGFFYAGKRLSIAKRMAIALGFEAFKAAV